MRRSWQPGGTSGQTQGTVVTRWSVTATSARFRPVPPRHASVFTEFMQQSMAVQMSRARGDGSRTGYRGER